ncbi:MAG: hypothetical protein LJE94_09330 [Deltaproteobacteria bacterium]|nr:hypothetical protein [Deltaproteobacteria bacterium]
MHADRKKIERRMHKRFAAREKTFAVLRSSRSRIDHINTMSMGEIACAVYNTKPAMVGEIVDISQGGLSFDCIECDDACQTQLMLDILSAGEKFYLDRIRFKPVRDEKTDEDASFSPIPRKKQGIQFVGLTFEQLSRLENFLRNHGMGTYPPDE